MNLSIQKSLPTFVVINKENSVLHWIAELARTCEVLDVDGGGSVSIEEFCDEMTKLATTHMPMDQIRVLKQISIIRGNVHHTRKPQICSSSPIFMVL